MFAERIDYKNHPKKDGPVSELDKFSNMIGGVIQDEMDQQKLRKKVVTYMTDVVTDQPPQGSKTASSRFSKMLHAERELSLETGSGISPMQSPPLPPPRAANVFSKKHEYVPEFFAPPVQQVRHATDADIERLRKSMDDQTNKLTPKQMAFWEKLSSATNSTGKARPTPPPNQNQVLVKYDSIPPEQLVFFDPAKSVNLMVSQADPEPLGAFMY